MIYIWPLWDCSVTIRCSLSLLSLWTSSSQAAYHFLAGLPECRFSVPAPESQRSVAVLAPIKERLSHSHIPFSRSFSCNRLSGNKKAGTQMRTDFPQKG